jgi:hypothetical protein
MQHAHIIADIIVLSRRRSQIVSLITGGLVLHFGVDPRPPKDYNVGVVCRTCICLRVTSVHN